MGVKQSSESNLWCTCANDSSYQPEFSSFLSPTGDEKTLYVPYIDELSPTATTKNAFELPLGLTLSSLRADDIVDGGDDICDACDDLSVMSAISPTKERRRVASQR